MPRSWQHLLAVVTILGGTSCTRIDPGPGAVPLSEFSVNIGAGDLLQPHTAAARLDQYLSELEAAGYKKQVRIILPPDWGPRIYEHWFPVLRARGFKALVILGQEKRDTIADRSAAIAWVKHILPLVRSDLIGIQIVNEPVYWFTPHEYADYHGTIAPLIRTLAPGVPIVAGDFSVNADGKNSLAAWAAFESAGTIDYDVISIHVTSKCHAGELRDFARRLHGCNRADRPIWITEGDWGQHSFLRAQGLPIAETFIYTWNDDAHPALIRRPGGRLP